MITPLTGYDYGLGMHISHGQLYQSAQVVSHCKIVTHS